MESRDRVEYRRRGNELCHVCPVPREREGMSGLWVGVMVEYMI